MTDTLALPTAVDYSATASEAYRAALSVIESIEPRIAAATRAELAAARALPYLVDVARAQVADRQPLARPNRGDLEHASLDQQPLLGK